jgi:RNA polymerase sigma-70 factor (ECF subfamily)
MVALGHPLKPFVRNSAEGAKPARGEWSKQEALAHADALYNFARRLAGNAEDAEDLVQDTYARAFGAASQFVAGTSVRAWLHRILRNAFVDRYRRARREPLLHPDDVEELDVQQGDAELVLLRRAIAEDVETALKALSVDARTIILLDLEGFTEAEMAGIVGCPINTVKSRLARARAALRARLRDYSK